MSEHVKVKDEKGLVREASSRAILVTDREAADAWRRKNSARKAQQQEIDTLKKDVSDMKHMLSAILEKLNNV